MLSGTLPLAVADPTARLVPPALARWTGRNTFAPPMRILLTLLVEDLEGLENLEEIASVEGVDIVNVGPHDMAMALGVTDPNDPRLRKTVEQAAERLRKVGKARFGFSIGHHWCPVTVAEARGMGVVYSNAGPPVGALLLNSYRKHVDSLRQDGA